MIIHDFYDPLGLGIAITHTYQSFQYTNTLETSKHIGSISFIGFHEKNEEQIV